jgi:serine protease Do
VEDGPSEKAGLEHGDVILEVDGRKIRSNRELIDRISARLPGDKVEVILMRNGKRLERTIVLGERPPVPGSAVEPAEPEEEEDASIEWLGISTQNLTSGLRATHEIPDSLEGVWITVVEPESPLYNEGVRPGDILTEVNGQPVGSVEDLRGALADRESGSVVRMYLTRVGRGGATASFFAIIRVP